jgi:type II secretory pathway predicted ATPase ExeA/UDP-N-acetylglucosamine 2-epimerase
MYESYFGLTGLPFQLGPDTRFFFAAGNYGDALDALRRGVENRAKLMVVSGQIGAGKTLLLRMLLERLESASISTVHLSGAHLDGTTLAETLSLALALPNKKSVRERLDGLVEHLRLCALPTLLAIDEAQHLTPDAFSFLESLAKANAGSAAPLQLLLVGQPELRSALEASENSNFKRILEVHLQLEPLDRIDTRSYIEYRLRQVGWHGTPVFESEAFHAIHDCTFGVPRKVHLLCNRLLMAAFAASLQRIDRALVSSAATELHAEFELSAAPVSGPAHPSSFSLATAPVPAWAIEPGFATASKFHIARSERPSAAVDHSSLAQVPVSGVGSRKLLDVNEAHASGLLLYVVAGLGDHVQAAASLRAIQKRGSLPPVRLVRAYVNAALTLNRGLFPDHFLKHMAPLSLGVAEWPAEGRADEVGDRFAAVVRSTRPCAVVVSHGSATALACAEVARANGVPVVHLGAGQRAEPASGLRDATLRAVDGLADMLLTESSNARENLEAEGVAPDRIHNIGSLAADVVNDALRRLDMGAPGLLRGLVPPAFMADRRGYGVIGLGTSGEASERDSLERMLRLLAFVSRDLALIWPLGESTRRATEAYRLTRMLDGERIACVPSQPHIAMVELMRHATCVLTNSWRVQLEALALRVPCLFIGRFHQRIDNEVDRLNYRVGESSTAATRAIWNIVYNGRPSARLPPSWDGCAADRMAASLEPFLSRQIGRR